jgi:AraC-like DNA-binding protein
MFLEPCEEGLTVICDWQAEDTPNSLYFVELCAVQVFAEKGTGRKVTPLRAECPGAENIPDSLAMELLGIPVVDGPLMKITFAEADLDTAFSMANPVTLKVLDDGLQLKLDEVSELWSERLKLTLKHMLPDKRHQLEEAAQAMSCTPRALQYQLATEGSSFKQVLNETRRELAFFYLSKMRFSPKETSFMLGYSEPPAFYHAFRRWSGQSPLDFQKTTTDQL